MADVGDQIPSSNSPTTPFRKVVLPPAEETAQVQRPPTAPPRPQPPSGPQPQPPSGPQARPQPPSGPQPRPQPQSGPQQRAAQPMPPQSMPRQPMPPQATPPQTKSPQPAQAAPGQAMRQQGVPPFPGGRPEELRVGGGPTAPTLPPVPPVPPRRGLGDIPIKVVYLIGAIVATVAAVLLVFVVFSGDVPANQQPSGDEGVVRVAPLPSASATPSASASASATPSASPVVLPPVPTDRALKAFPGTPAVVIGTISDKTVGISYPRLAAPWQARSYPPYSIAQRIGKVEMPYTLIASAMYPGESPAKKPSSDADYREIATDAVRWAMRSQYPKGATVEWTASQKVPVGKGWTLGYKVTYTEGGEQQVAQALVTVVEVGKTKPAMLLASIPETNKARWPDLGTIARQVRPL
ncbi:hypothetical protein [Nonomuraea wenchangensis]|uniref:hypothetical protein n=1 Tax=Nonomuraea wenchangensis TaxID=568860 RepID=UPI0033309385